MRFLVSGLVVLMGCGDVGAIRADGDAAGNDGGAGVDAGAADAPPGSPNESAVPATDDSLGLFGVEGDRGELDEGDPLVRASCYDGEDNDALNGADCRDESCRALRSCCVADGDCCSPTTIPDVPNAIDFGTCTSFDDCFGADRWAFVGTAASLSPEGMSPEGSALGEGGVALLTPIDISTHRLELELDLTPPDDCASMSCVESLGLGLVDQPPAIGEGITIEPPIAIVYSGARDAVSIMREGTELARLPRMGSNEMSLVARPTGEISVTVGTQEFALSGAFEPRSLHVVLYGRTRNPGASDNRATALRSLTITTDLCDMPAAWAARTPLGFDAGQPSIARSPSAMRMAFVDTDGRIALAEEVDDEWVMLPGRVSHEDLGDGYKRVADPELFFDGTRWQVFFTVERDEGSTLIWSAEYSDGFLLDEDGFLEGARAPTLAVSTLGVAVMVVNTDTGLVPHRYSEEGAWTQLDFSLLGSVARSIGGEVGTASLVQHNRAWHLYVAIRRGARWSIHLLSSDEMLAWRHVGQALGPGTDFDRILVRAPDVWAEGDLLRMVYEAEDGVGRSIGFTTRRSTPAGSF